LSPPTLESTRRPAIPADPNSPGRDQTPAIFEECGQDSSGVVWSRCQPLVERAASDERNFVKKGVTWGLRGVGRRSPRLHAAAITLARRLSASPEPAARWVGRDALKDLTRPTVTRRFAARRRRA